MFKNKTIKFFLIFGVIIFSLVGLVGCSNKGGNNNVNATYIETFSIEEEIDEKINIIDNRFDLVSLLENNTPEKYDDSFFDDKSLLIFKIIESNNENKSEIESYQICDNTLKVYIETKIVKDNCANNHWWFILELNKDDIKNFDNIKIFKNEEKIIEDFKSNTNLQQKKYYYSYSFNDVKKWPEFIGEEYNLSFEERRYYFILSFIELTNIFENSTGNNINEYFNASIFNENLVLCVVRDETGGTANIKYSDFKVNGLELSIKENYIDGGAEVVSRYLDFVVIPKRLFPNGNFNKEIEYYWK